MSSDIFANPKSVSWLPRQVTATFNLLKISTIWAPLKNVLKLDGANRSPLNKTSL